MSGFASIKSNFNQGYHQCISQMMHSSLFHAELHPTPNYHFSKQASLSKEFIFGLRFYIRQRFIVSSPIFNFFICLINPIFPLNQIEYSTQIFQEKLLKLDLHIFFKDFKIFRLPRAHQKNNLIIFLG